MNGLRDVLLAIALTVGAATCIHSPVQSAHWYETGCRVLQNSTRACMGTLRIAGIASSALMATCWGIIAITALYGESYKGFFSAGFVAIINLAGCIDISKSVLVHAVLLLGHAALFVQGLRKYRHRNHATRSIWRGQVIVSGLQLGLAALRAANLCATIG